MTMQIDKFGTSCFSVLCLFVFNGLTCQWSIRKSVSVVDGVEPVPWYELIFRWNFLQTRSEQIRTNLKLQPVPCLGHSRCGHWHPMQKFDVFMVCFQTCSGIFELLRTLWGFPHVFGRVWMFLAHCQLLINPFSNWQLSKMIPEKNEGLDESRGL